MDAPGPPCDAAASGERIEIRAEALDADQAYKLLCGVVVPRPIAWITTLSPGGGINLAPFSCYTFVSNRPPMLGVTFGSKAGTRKDTATHILARREYVVNVGNMHQLEAIHRSSEEFPSDVSEVELLGLRTTPSARVATPRLTEAPIAMECRLVQTMPFGDAGSEFFVGEILAFQIRPDLYRDGKIDTRALDPVARLAGPNYARLGEIIRMAPVAATPRGARPRED